MADQFVAEIRIFAGNFAPFGWALCDGQLMSISQNTALFSLLGINYGGNGTSTFGLPNLQGCAPLHVGAAQPGPGLSIYALGESGGEQTVTLLRTEMPMHTHTVQCLSAGEGDNDPTNAVWAGGGRGAPPTYTPAGNNTQMNPFGTLITGGNLPHNNMPPFLGLTFIIALQGIYPSRP